MLSIFKKKVAEPPKAPTPSPVSGAPTAAASKQKSLNLMTKVKRTLKNMVNDPIPKYGLFSEVPEADYIKFHKRFDTLFGRYHKSTDPGIRFLINQLYISRDIFEALSSKVVLKETDREIVKMFFGTLKTLYKLLITKAEDEGLRNELVNYNTFLYHLFDRGINKMIRLQTDYDRKLKLGKVLPKAQNEAGNAEKTAKAYKALDDMMDGLNGLPYMSANLQIKLDKSKHELVEAMSALEKVSKTADATSAALMTGMAAALNGSSGSSGSNNGSNNGAAFANGRPSMDPAQLAKLEAGLAELEAGLNANNGFGKAHAALNALNGKVAQYTGVNTAEPTNAELNAYLAELKKKPTGAPQGGRRKTRKMHRRKTRKMRR